MDIPADALERALLVERTRLHRATSPSVIVTTLLAALITWWILQPHASAAALSRWLLALGAALTLRAAIVVLHGRDPEREQRAARWLARYRLAFVAHGLAWAALGLLVLPGTAHDGFDILLFTLTAMTAASLISTAYDIGAALAFAVPTLSPIMLQLAVQPDRTSLGLSVAIGVFVAFALMSAARAHLMVLHGVRLRLAEAANAEEARRQAAAAESAREALAQQNHQMDQLLRNTRQGYWFIDNRGMTTDVNPAMCALLGRPREDIVGRSVFEFFAGEDLLTLHDEIERRRQGGAGGYEIGIRRPDGSRLLCFNHATPMVDIHGEQIGSVGLWTDLTPIRQTEAALRMYEVVTNSITDAVSVIDEHGIYRAVNDAWCRMSNLTRERVIGHGGQDLYPFVASDERQLARTRCLEENRPQSVRSPLPGRSDRMYETTYYPYLATGSRSIVIVTRDVTEQDDARRQLQTSAEVLRGTLDATSDAIFATDALTPHEPIRFANRQMLRLWGIPESRAATLTSADILAYASPHFVDPVAELRRVDDIIAGNLPDETRLTLRDGRILLRRCVATPMHGRTIRIWSFRDITASERTVQVLRDSEARVRHLLDAFPGYIAAVDTKERYAYVNERLARVLGGTPASIVGQSMRTVLGAELYAEVASEMAAARRDGRATGERTYRTEGGTQRIDLEVTQLRGPGVDDAQTLIYVFGQDITARKRAEEALISARDEAENANRAKSQFLSQMSHELRTPMNAIIGFAQLLETDPHQPLSDAQTGYVQQILRGGRHLLGLINEVLDLGRIDAGRMQIDQTVVPVQPLLASCLGFVRPLALERHVVLPDPGGPDCPHGVLGDRTRLKQVLLNLLGNAIKYNRDGGRVTIDCRASGQHLVIEVGDEGRGLTAAQQQRLFTPFERLDADLSGVEGTGIGLALSQRLIQMMGGEIGVHSAPGAGSTFWIRLPLAAKPVDASESARRLPTDAAAGADGDRLTVLYIEDNPVNTVLMDAMLARVPGLRLVTAALPRDGLEIARRDVPALILLDIQLPGMDGYEVLRHLRADHRTAAIPVVAVSAHSRELDVEPGRAGGFDACLGKPLDMRELLDTVRRLLTAPVGDPG